MAFPSSSCPPNIISDEPQTSYCAFKKSPWPMQCLYRIGHRLKDNSKVEEGKGFPNCDFITLHMRETDIGIPCKTFQINISENLASLVKQSFLFGDKSNFSIVTSVRYFEPDRPYHLKFSLNLLNLYSKQQMFKQSQP